MPRDAAGTYILPSGNPVANGTPIVTTWAVSLFNDISVALTNSLAVPGSVTPNKLSNDAAGFQAKIGVDTFFTGLEARCAALEAANAARIGFIRPFAHGTVPPHFLECNGAEVSRTQYATLFAKIGTTFGAGDGATTFNLPDLREKTIRGWDHGRGVDAGRVFGSSQGSIVPQHTHTASSASAGSHSHTGTTDSGGVHAHTASSTAASTHTHTFSGTTANHSATHTHTWSATTGGGGGHSHTFSYSTNNGDNGSTDNIVNSGSGLNRTTSSAGNHSHTVSGTTSGQSANHTHSISGTTSSAGAHTHSVTVSTSSTHTHTLTTSTNPDHTHSVTVDSTGSGGMAVRARGVMMCIKYE